MHGNHHAGPAPPRRTVHRSAPRLVLADWPATPEAPRSPSRNSPRTRKIQSAEATRTPFHAEISSPGSPVFRPLEHQDPQSYHAAGKHLVEAIFDPHVHLLGMDQGESTATVEHGGASGANKPAIVPPPSELVCLRLLTGHPISELKTQFTAVQLKEGLEKAFEDADFKARVEVELREEARAKRRLAKQEREKMEAEAEARRKAEARERRLRRLKAKTEEEEEADNRLILKMLEDADYSEEELRTTGLDVDGLATLNAALHAASSDNVATRLLKGAITKGSVGHRLRIRNHVVEISRAKIGHDPSSLMDVRKVIWGRAAHQDVDGEIVAVDERVLGSVELLNFSGVVASEHIRVIIENPAMVWRAGQQMNKNKATHLEVTDWVYKALRMDLPRRIVVPPQERQFSEKASMEKRVVSKQPLVGTSKDCQLAICLYGAGYSATDIRDAGFSGPVIQGVGCKRSDLLKAGFPADCTVGLRWVEVAHHEATDIREFASVKFEDMVAQKYRTFKTNQPRTLELTQRELLELQRDVAAEHGTLDWDVRIKLCKGSSAADTVSPKTSRSASPFGSRVTRTTSPLSMPTSLPQTSESATLFRPVAGRRRRFAGVEGLLHTIESGAIAPLRGSYLQKLWQKKQDGCPVQDWRVACRQELPSDAFWTHGQLRELYDMLCEKHGNNRALATQLFCEVFHAVSARRLSEKHADPEGFHLDVLGPMVERRMKEEFCVQPNGTSTTLFGRVFTGLRVGIPCDIAVYWDWPSLYQEPCAHEEEVLHKEGLKASHIWFGHKHSTVWFQTKTPRCPEVWVHGDSCFANLNLSISFLLKAHSNYLLDLAKDELDMDSVDWGQAADASAIQMQSAYRGWRSRQEKKSKGLPPANENPRGEYVRALERCKMKRKLPGNPQSFMLTLQRKVSRVYCAEWCDMSTYTASKGPRAHPVGSYCGRD